jgi:hypothetical protein
MLALDCLHVIFQLKVRSHLSKPELPHATEMNGNNSYKTICFPPHFSATAGGVSWNQLNETEEDVVDGKDGLQGLRFDTSFVREHAVAEDVITYCNRTGSVVQISDWASRR